MNNLHPNWTEEAILREFRICRSPKKVANLTGLNEREVLLIVRKQVAQEKAAAAGDPDQILGTRLINVLKAADIAITQDALWDAFINRRLTAIPNLGKASKKQIRLFLVKNGRIPPERIGPRKPWPVRPGSSEPPTRWPFQTVSLPAVLALSDEGLAYLEGAMQVAINSVV